jgi:predicted Zn-dependent protease
MLRRYNSGQDPQTTASPAAARICFHLARTDRWTAEGGRETADALRRELERGCLTREEEMLVLDALMTDALIDRDPALLARLDAWSSRALALGPEVRTLHGSRGAALVELGHFAEAKALLEPLAAADVESFDRLLSCAFLARAEYALGNPDTARRLATDAHTICKASHSQWPSVTSFVDGVVAEVGASPGA